MLTKKQVLSKNVSVCNIDVGLYKTFGWFSSFLSRYDPIFLLTKVVTKRYYKFGTDNDEMLI